MCTKQLSSNMFIKVCNTYFFLFQIPGRFVFSVLRKYLQLTSMSQQDEAATPLPPIGPDGQQRELTEFEMFYLHNQLFSELFTAFGWYEGTLDEEVQQGNDRVLKGLSIFTGTLSEEVKVSGRMCVCMCVGRVLMV